MISYLFHSAHVPLAGRDVSNKCWSWLSHCYGLLDVGQVKISSVQSMRLNVRTAKIITLTAVFGGVAIYDYTYVSNLHTDQRRTEEKGLFEDIEINDEISSYLAQPTPGVPRPEAQASTTAGEGAGYVPALEEILAGEITPAEHVKPQSDRHINLGFILINLQPGSSQLSKKFSNQVSKGGSSWSSNYNSPLTTCCMLSPI